MAKICEHEFEQEDPKQPGYSMTEFDLAARLGLTIRRNLKTRDFEICTIKDKLVAYRGSLPWIVKMANQLERANHIKLECGLACPLPRPSPIRRL